MSEISEYIAEHLLGTERGKALEPVIEAVTNPIIDSIAEHNHIPTTEGEAAQIVIPSIADAIANLEKKLEQQ